MQPILKLDLNTGSAEPFLVPQEWQDDYLGGASLAARLLYKPLKQKPDPLSPEAPLLFLNGPLTGTAGPAVGRTVICGRSPATGLWAESNIGGFWGTELRKAGYDGIWIEGRAPEPIFLWINDGRPEIHSAASMGGLDTYEIQSAVKDAVGEPRARVAGIGPAGEAGLPFALILCDHGRVAGRTGLGAVMGSKNLKAIAAYGTGPVPVARPERYSQLRSDTNRRLRKNAQTRVLRELGTSGAADYFNYLGEMPKRYFSRGTFDEDLRVSGSAVQETILAGVSACHGCVIACGRVVRLNDGNKRKGPEYETLVGFGPNLMLNDPVLATQLGELCDRLGMDSISASGTIGLAYRLFELGKITVQDTGGWELRWGNPTPLAPLLEQMASRTGFGAYLAGGALALARRFGAEAEAVQVNGLEVAYHDPRGASGMALVYATSPRGACHNQSDYFLVDIGQAESELGLEYFSRHSGAEKAGNVALHQDWRTVCNALVLCFFTNIPPDDVLELVNAACGLHWKMPDLLRSGERAWNLKRAINIHLGLTASNDTLPEALLIDYKDEPDGNTFPVPPFPEMMEAYYASRGWDPNTGVPLRWKLEELGLGDVADDLWVERT